MLRPCRKLGLALASQWPWPVKCRIRTGRSMYVDLRSAVGRGIYMKGEFDPAVFDPFEKILQPGDTFLDVGANVGYYSMLALDRIGATGLIHAFEIDERPLRGLRKSILTQHLTNLHLHEIAVGDRSGSIRLVRENDCGNSHVTDQKDLGFEVPMTTLDEWYRRENKPFVRAIKMDIEGAELRALKGAVQLLTESRPVLVCEAWDGGHPAQSEAARFLCSLGYSVQALQNVHSPVVVATPLVEQPA
jgi:FkbM family methyltransferase